VRRALRTLAVGCLVAGSGVGAAAAQAPRITPHGDPTVRDDTIYALAVDPAEHPDQNIIYLLNDAVARYEPNGHSRQTYRQVVQLLTQAAAEQWGDITFPFSSERQRLTINWIRVLRPDGQVISSKPAHEQVAIAPIAQEAPVYSDTRVRQVTLSGVGPNTIVDLSYTIEDRKPLIRGDFFAAWKLNTAAVATGAITRRSRFVVDVPEEYLPRIQERNIHFARQMVVRHGRRVYTWATSDPPRPDREPFAPDSNPFLESITVAPPLSWGDVARWYAGISHDRYKLTPALEQQLSTVVGMAPTLDDSLKALYRWVAQDFRYVALSMGIGGYRPRQPMSVWETKYGDCKDKATLFIALARRLGVTAYPVLLSADGYVNRSAPSAYQLDHMIVAVIDPAAPGEGYRYLDLTSDLTPYGTLPAQEQGAFALVVHPEGQGDEVTLPTDPIAVNRAVVEITGELHLNGTFDGRYVEEATGNRQYVLRSAFASTFGAAERTRLTRDLANTLFQGATGDSLVSFNGRDLAAEPRVALNIRGARPVSVSGGSEVLTLPIKNYSAASVVADLETRGHRRSPIDVGAVVGPYEERSEFRLVLPEGWHARLPRNIDAASEFGRYRASYVQIGRELRVERTIAGASGIAPPEDIEKLLVWLRKVSTDDVSYVVLDRSS
jgi:transglutaminase-like putative cysteine protease